MTPTKRLWLTSDRSVFVQCPWLIGTELEALKVKGVWSDATVTAEFCIMRSASSECGVFNIETGNRNFCKNFLSSVKHVFVPLPFAFWESDLTSLFSVHWSFALNGISWKTIKIVEVFWHLRLIAFHLNWTENKWNQKSFYSRGATHKLPVNFDNKFEWRLKGKTFLNVVCFSTQMKTQWILLNIVFGVSFSPESVSEGSIVDTSLWKPQGRFLGRAIRCAVVSVSGSLALPSSNLYGVQATQWFSSVASPNSLFVRGMSNPRKSQEFHTFSRVVWTGYNGLGAHWRHRSTVPHIALHCCPGDPSPLYLPSRVGTPPFLATTQNCFRNARPWHWPALCPGCDPLHNLPELPPPPWKPV